MNRRGGRGLYRGVYSALVNDLDFQRLTPEARHVLLTMRVSEEVGPACIFRCYPQVIEEQTGYAQATVAEALAELSAKPRPDAPWIFCDGPVIWIRNGLRHDPTMNLANERQLKSVVRAIIALPPLPIIATFCRYYGITKAMRKAMGIPSRKAMPYPIEVSDSESDSDSDTETETESESDARATAGGSLTRPPSDGAGAEDHRRCRVCRHAWYGLDRCPKMASHASA